MICRNSRIVVSLFDVRDHLPCDSLLGRIGRADAARRPSAALRLEGAVVRKAAVPLAAPDAGAPADPAEVPAVPGACQGRDAADADAGTGDLLVAEVVRGRP